MCRLLLMEDPGRPGIGGHSPCTRVAPVKGWDDLQALRWPIRVSDTSHHRLASLRGIPVPHTSASLLISGHRAPQGHRPTMLIPSPSPGDLHLVSQGGGMLLCCSFPFITFWSLLQHELYVLFHPGLCLLTSKSPAWK